MIPVGDEQEQLYIRRGSLKVFNARNGYYLYGVTEEGEDIYITCMCDELPENIEVYDPNQDHDLPEAYGFEFVDVVVDLLGLTWIFDGERVYCLEAEEEIRENGELMETTNGYACSSWEQALEILKEGDYLG